MSDSGPTETVSQTDLWKIKSCVNELNLDSYQKVVI